jgi:hypothetical protein
LETRSTAAIRMGFLADDPHSRGTKRLHCSLDRAHAESAASLGARLVSRLAQA